MKDKLAVSRSKETLAFTIKAALFFGFNLICLLVLVSVCCSRTPGQTKPTDGGTPLGLQAGTPAGSYGLSGGDNVNLYNGALNFTLPLLSIGGRGSAGHT